MTEQTKVRKPLRTYMKPWSIRIGLILAIQTIAQSPKPLTLSSRSGTFWNYRGMKEDLNVLASRWRVALEWIR